MILDIIDTYFLICFININYDNGYTYDKFKIREVYDYLKTK